MGNSATQSVTVIVVQPPTNASVGGQQEICTLGTTARLGGNTPTSGTGAWSVVSGGTGSFSPDASTPNATFTHASGAGLITLRWTISNSPCTASSADVTVTVNPLPDTPTGSTPQTICSGSLPSATVGSGETVEWYSGSCGGTQVTSITSSGTYHARAKSSAGCYSQNCLSVVVTVDNGPPPTDGTPTADATDKITWKWSDVSGETGYRVRDTGGTQKGSDLAADSIQWQETSLTANTQYTRKIHAFSDCGESTGSTGQTRWTLSVAPTAGSLTNDKPSPVPGDTITWTAVGGFGAGTIQYYRHAWDQTATHTWTDAETQWSSGTIGTNPTVAGTWYLHIKGYNGENAGNGTHDYEVTVAANNNQITGTVTFATSSGTEYTVYRDVVFKATDSSSTVLQTWTVNLLFTNNTDSKVATSATYTLQNVPQDTAKLSAKTAWTLRKKLDVTLDEYGQAVANFTLLGGDVNVSNSINVLDYTLLKVNWGSSNAQSDVNGDGVINTLDYGIMKDNWFKVGDQP